MGTAIRRNYVREADGYSSGHKSADIEHGRNGYQPSKGANHRTEFNDLPKVGSGIMPPKQGKSD